MICKIAYASSWEYKWISTQGVEEDSILIQLPVDLHRDKTVAMLNRVQRVSDNLVVGNIFCNNGNHLFYIST
jgi:hypothetical protein